MALTTSARVQRTCRTFPLLPFPGSIVLDTTSPPVKTLDRTYHNVVDFLLAGGIRAQPGISEIARARYSAPDY